jgi:uncharacterized membrane protein YoaK (UPF0700 family)
VEPVLVPVDGVPDGIVVAVVAAAALGVQNSVARHLTVPDLTTTVLTMTLTGIAADVRTSRRPVVVRRLLAVLTMFVGAAVSAVRRRPRATDAARVGAGIRAASAGPWSCWC